MSPGWFVLLLMSAPSIGPARCLLTFSTDTGVQAQQEHWSLSRPDLVRQMSGTAVPDPKPCNVDATPAGLASGDSGQRSPTCLRSLP